METLSRAGAEDHGSAGDAPLPVDLAVVDSAAAWGNSSVRKHQHKHNLKHRYELLETLGRGTYGKVKKAVERHTGRVVSLTVRVCCQIDHTIWRCVAKLITFAPASLLCSLYHL